MPNPGIYNKHVFEKDKNTFFHHMMLKSHFGNADPIQYRGYRCKTNKGWLPNNTHHSVKTFIEYVNKDLTNAQRIQQIQNNLTKGEIHSLHHLRNRDNIIIIKPDKSGAVVIVNIEDYLAEAKRQLSNTNFYTTLDVNPTATHADIVKNTIRNIV